MLEEIRIKFFLSAQFDVGPACPYCSLSHKGSMSQSLLLVEQWGRAALERGSKHVLPLATSGQTMDTTDSTEDAVKQFERCPALYCNTREVALTHSNVERWLQISQVRFNPSISLYRYLIVFCILHRHDHLCNVQHTEFGKPRMLVLCILVEEKVIILIKLQ